MAGANLREKGFIVGLGCRFKKNLYYILIACLRGPMAIYIEKHVLSICWLTDYLTDWFSIRNAGKRLMDCFTTGDVYMGQFPAGTHLSYGEGSC